MNRYFYIDAEGKQKGTFSPEELRQEGIKRDTLVWTQGMEQWKRAEETDELRFLFSGTYNSPPQVTVESSATIPQPMPKTWLVESILVTILPFMFCSSVLSLLGIIGIIYAAQVESFYNRGDYAASLESSRSAAKWTKIAMWIAIGWVLLLIIAVVLVFVFVGSFAGVSDLLNT
ncbi:GYF domain-containing protein [Proteiniphilum sp. UBA5384]|uniref:GYF domain-containing protein n=1 Tax=Proteiniphilum sp. UBA5384 TaxID=1947279 RepID=UPI0025EF7E44|nr:GYF domain-containing protein [Proteiniphilum sp. UBA5384]